MQALDVSGGIAGMSVAPAAAQLIRNLLSHVEPKDQVTYAAVALQLGLVALAATLMPAQVAMQVEPLVAVWYE